jgi:hypothetical protein
VHAGDSSLVCSGRSGVLVARVGVPLADAYLEFLGGRCRPNTVRAAAYDLKVFFSVVGRPPEQVRPVDVLAFITAQHRPRRAAAGAGGRRAGRGVGCDGADSLQVLDEAIDQLARLRTPYWLGDSAVRLHALASLITQAQQLLPQAIHDARDQELTWAQIGELLNVTATTAARRYRDKP